MRGVPRVSHAAGAAALALMALWAPAPCRAADEVLVLVKSDPPGADVFLDDETAARGQTPCAILVPPGRHTVRAVLGDARGTAEVVAAPDKVETVRLALAAPSGSSTRAAEAQAPLLAGFDSLIEKGDYEGARKEAERAASGSDNADSTAAPRGGATPRGGAALRAAARVARALSARRAAIRRAVAGLTDEETEIEIERGKFTGKVEWADEDGIVFQATIALRGKVMGRTRMKLAWSDFTPAQERAFAREGGWRPEGPDGAVARAYLALARKEVASAQAALRAAGDHPLAAHLRARLAGSGPTETPIGKSAPSRAGPRETPKRPPRVSSPTRRRPLNYARFTALHTLSGHTDDVIWCAFSPDGSIVVTSSRDETARTWDAATGLALHTMEAFALGSGPAWFSPDGQHILTAPKDHEAMIWDAATGREVRRLRRHSGHVDVGVYSPSGKRIATGDDDTRKSSVKIWEAATGRLLHDLAEHRKGRVHCAAFSPDDRRLVTGSGETRACVWDVETGRQLHVLEHDTRVTVAAFSPDGERVVTGNPVRFWDVRTGRRLAEFEGHDFAEFSPDGRLFLTIQEQYADVWDAKTGRSLVRLKGHRERLTSASFSSDGSWVVTASKDTTARVWQTATGRTWRVLSGHTGVVLCAALSPDGRRIVTASEDMTARIWGNPRDAARPTPRPPAQPVVAGSSPKPVRAGKTGGKTEADVPPRPVPAAAGLSRVPKASTISRLFPGAVRRWKPETLEIELFYDFQDPRQARDWSLTGWYFLNRGSARMEIAGGVLRMTETGRCALLGARFRSVTARVDFDSTRRIGFACLVACSNGGGDFYNLVGAKSARLEKHVAGEPTPLSGTKPSPFARTLKGTMSLSFGNGRLTGKVGDETLEASDTAYDSGYFGFHAPDCKITFDNLHLVGVLDPAWLEEAVAPLDRNARGLCGTYFRGEKFEEPLFRRIDAQVDFDWRDGPLPLGGGAAPEAATDRFSVRWDGFVVPPATGRYTFEVVTSHRAEVRVADGHGFTEPLRFGYNDEHPRPPPPELRAGARHRIVIEYHGRGGDAAIRLLWSGPGSPEPRPVPSRFLLPPENPAKLPGPRLRR